MSVGEFSILVSQVTEPSAAVTQLVGTIFVEGPTLLPGPSMKVCTWASAGDATADRARQATREVAEGRTGR